MPASVLALALLIAGRVHVESAEHPGVAVEFDDEGLCLWTPEEQRSCPPELHARLAPLAAELDGEEPGELLVLAFVPRFEAGGDLALSVSTRPPQPRTEGDELRFATAQLELLCGDHRHMGRRDQLYTLEEFGGVPTLAFVEFFDQLAFSYHRVFRGRQALVSSQVRWWPPESAKARPTAEAEPWADRLDAGVRVDAALAEPDDAPLETSAWLPGRCVSS
ncbi:hypothetical protein G6O69_38200 [Pseudenhygromyxa sp. WMMC2535]|uniref:hypothetical protein n=1 Tax=Pseudenhygromyxa sp. WMMC2535 TaxID=2712867 RepID=UPI00159507F5|nr:hypothetical protein [Pseudenhygromyxa sp. WMMC2535]NVB43700.1 hypothetical protein [Pseudenhygromyxa sp. WMMC2535]